jgi:hypothetical protein
MKIGEKIVETAANAVIAVYIYVILHEALLRRFSPKVGLSVVCHQCRR